MNQLHFDSRANKIENVRVLYTVNFFSHIQI